MTPKYDAASGIIAGELLIVTVIQVKTLPHNSATGPDKF
jgi:hypothetical protein